MKLKKYLVVSYGILVKAGKWALEKIEGEEKPTVPEEYVVAVAEYLATQGQSVITQ
ncbi:CD1375 family protein [Clostridium niameyense]|uniref:CD1375 family protein n=1 Tax=Clostridium niameyense TaxID=1622073 RepID=UPI0013CF56AB|nr:CD1375 family protein [Clostridium niameyense]